MKLLKDLGVIYFKDGAKQKNRVGIFECEDCKGEVRARFTSVKSNNQKYCIKCSCKKNSTIHGKSHLSLHKRWKAMISRCHNKKDTQYHNYGEKGVKVCQEWIDSYNNFEAWSLSNGYDEGLELDKDKLCNELNIHPKIYSPETCLWMSRKENSKHKEPSRKRKNCSSEYIGVSWSEPRKKWKVTYKRKHIGYYDNETEARDKWIERDSTPSA